MTLGVTVLPKDDSLQRAIMGVVQSWQQKRSEDATRAQQQGQFDKTYELEKQRTDSLIGTNAASVENARATTLDARAKDIAAGFFATADALRKKGATPEKIQEFVVDGMRNFADETPSPGGAEKPPALKELYALVRQRIVTELTKQPDSPGDQMVRGALETGAAATGRAAAGGQNPNDIDWARKVATGEASPAAAYADQQQREAGDGQHSRFVKVAGDLAPGANQQLQANTMVQVGREQNASAERIANARVAAAASASGTGDGIPASANGKTGVALLQSLDPALADVVKGVAEYRINPVQVASSRNPKNAESERMKLVQLATQYNPDYDMTQYPAMAAARKDFTSGKAAANIRSLNTAVKHLDEFVHAAEALDNTGIPFINKVGNYVAKQSGGDAVTNFHSAATALADELATLFKGTAGTDSAIAHWRESLDPNMSPEQFEGQKKILLELVGGRIAALQDQYRATTGLPKDFDILSPTSKKVLDKFGFEYSSVKPGAAGDGGAAPETRTTPDGKTWRKVAGGWEEVR